MDAVRVEGVVDVVGEVVADGGGREGDAGGPLGDKVFDVGEAVGAGVVEVGSELRGSDVGDAQGFGAGCPDGGDPGEISAGVPFVGEVVPGAFVLQGLFDCGAIFES